MTGNVGDRVITILKITFGIVALIAFLSLVFGCTVLHVSYDKHFVGEPPKEERAADLIERIFEDDNETY